MKIQAFAAILVLVVLVSGCLGKEKVETQNLPTTGAYVFKLPESEIGEGWKLVWEAKNMVDWPLEQQKEFASKGIVDAAGWKYVRGNESLYIWARNFANLADLEKVESKTLSPFSWKDISALAFADVAQIGVFGPNKEFTTLFLYAAQNNTMFFVQYTNQFFNEHERYDKTNLFDDKRFLVGLARKLLAK